MEHSITQIAGAVFACARHWRCFQCLQIWNVASAVACQTISIDSIHIAPRPLGRWCAAASAPPGFPRGLLGRGPPRFGTVARRPSVFFFLLVSASSRTPRCPWLSADYTWSGESTARQPHCRIHYTSFRERLASIGPAFPRGVCDVYVPQLFMTSDTLLLASASTKRVL